MRKLLTITALLFVFSIGAQAADKCDTTKLIKAIQAQQKIEKLGFSWRDTYKKLLGPAKKAMRKGDCAKAEKLIADAMDHINLGMEQYRKSFGAKLHK